MRLFTAIAFDERTKSRLTDEMLRLKNFARAGNFTRRENLHLTVKFLGEEEERGLPAIKKALDDAARGVRTLDLEINSFGSFPAGSGRRIYWRGVSTPSELIMLYESVCRETEKLGFKSEKRRYTPHVTLIRNCKMSFIFREQDFARGLSPVRFKGEKLCLMQSLRQEGKLVYVPLYEVSLN